MSKIDAKIEKLFDINLFSRAQIWELHCDFFEHVLPLKYLNETERMAARQNLGHYRKIKFLECGYSANLPDLRRVALWAANVAANSQDVRRSYVDERRWQLKRIEHLIEQGVLRCPE